jgi:hypothetical protein
LLPAKGLFGVFANLLKNWWARSDSNREPAD